MRRTTMTKRIVVKGKSRKVVARKKRRLYVGDCIQELRKLPDNSVDSIVTDPPYGLEFMGKDWDAPWKDARTDKRGIVNPAEWGGNQDSVSGGNAYSRSRVRHGHAASYKVNPAKTGQQFQAWCEQWAAECLRVLKPGGHILSFGGTRTYHRMVCAIEDAGFEVRDSIHWIYGSGFPKSLNAFKNIKEQLCPSHESAPHAALVSPWHPVASPEAKAPIAVALARTLQGDVPVLLTRTGEAGDSPAMTATSWSELTATTSSNTDTSWRNIWDALCDPTSTSTTSTTTAATTAWQTCNSLTSQNTPDSTTPGRADPNDGCKCSAATVATPSSAASLKCSAIRIPTAPASAIGLGADYLAGTGTAAKPSHEPIVVARKPLTGTVAGNVLAHGTGAINVDGCRVGTDGGARRGPDDVDKRGPANAVLGAGLDLGNAAPRIDGLGRWPANVILDSEAGNSLDTQDGANGASRFFKQVDWEPDYDVPFIYQAKANKKERNAGVEQLPAVFAPTMGNGIGGKEHDPDTATPKHNHHPTVKPVALMRYLIRLVTPPGGTVLDPFLGSGTTAVAAIHEGMNWIGVERSEEYVPIIKARVIHAHKQLKGDDND